MDGECLSFLRLPAPTEGEVQNVAERTAKRVAAILKNRGRSIEGLSGGEEGYEPALVACYDVAARAPALRVVEPSRIREDERVAVVMGFNVHAGAAIDGRDRKRVERVCRYLVRPPIATERLGFVGENVRYELKKVWRDGARCVVLDPYDVLARVCAMVPPPRLHRVRFHGVLAPNASLRREVVSSARSSAAPKVAPPRAPLQLPLFGELFDVDDATGGKARRKPWAWLLRHVFAIDVTTCPKCTSTMRWRNVALTPDAIREGLARAGLSARGPPMRKRVPLGQLSLPFPKAHRREQP